MGWPHLLSDQEKQYENGSVPDTFRPEPIDPRLYRAVLNGEIDLFNILTTSLGPRLELQASPQGNTVLHVAASLGRAEIVELIIQRCFSLLASKNSDGDTPLHLAAGGGRLSTVVTIINGVKQRTASSSMDIEAGGWELLTATNKADNNALHQALKNRHEEVAKFLIEQEPKVWGLPNKENKSPLYLAAEAGFLDIVNYIIDNIEKHNQSVCLKGMSPAIAAIIARRTDILKATMQLPPELRGSTDQFGRNPFHYAAWFGNVEGVVCLVRESTVGVCQGDKEGFSPLHIAATSGHVDVIKKLLKYCPYAEELLDRMGRNILHAAAEYGKENVVTYILRTPALERLINATDYEGRTPLHLATLSGHPKIVKILTMDKRIDMKVMTKGGDTAFDIATQEVENKYSFRGRLTWMALRAARAPRSKYLNKLQQDTRLEFQAQWGHPTSNYYQEREKAKLSMTGSYKDRINTLQVVAMLIATISFAAGFTLPGGYNSEEPDKGVAILLKKWTFQAYVICNTISLYSSIIVVVALMWAQLGDVYLMRYVLNLVTPWLGLALSTTCLAFMTGVHLAVTRLTWLGVAVLLLGSICLVGIFILFLPVWYPRTSEYGIVRYLMYRVFLVLLFVSKSSRVADDIDEKGDDEMVGMTTLIAAEYLPQNQIVCNSCLNCKLLF